jgi:uncharacterized protein (UPF0276 family)
VWQLYGYTLQHCGTVPTMIERDDNIPALHELLDELDQARVVQAQALMPSAQNATEECAA